MSASESFWLVILVVDESSVFLMLKFRLRKAFLNSCRGVSDSKAMNVGGTAKLCSVCIHVKIS